MSTERARDAEVELPDGVELKLDGRTLTAKGPLGTVRRSFPAETIRLTGSSGKVRLELLVPPNRKSSRALLGTWVAHVRNLGAGLTRGVEAKLKVVAAHFPMKVQVRGSELVIENFLGEKHPRSTGLLAGTTAVVDGEFVTVRGFDVEQVGQSAANIERVTRIRDYDPRVFQDGIYLIERAHVNEGS